MLQPLVSFLDAFPFSNKKTSKFFFVFDAFDLCWPCFHEACGGVESVLKVVLDIVLWDLL